MTPREQTGAGGRDVEGMVFDIQKFSLHDGPGIRTIVFLKGCSLKCIWCSNPESQKSFRQILFNASKCIDCGTCREICAQNAVSGENQSYPIDTRLCDGCGRCCEECPTQALKWSGKPLRVSAVLAEIEKDRAFYESSGGGVTFSGGEPLSQPMFLKHLLSACRSSGIHTAVETCGFSQWKYLQEVVPHTNLFLFDLKHMDPAVHKEMTGRGNRVILENLKKLNRSGANIIVRIPVVQGVNDSKANLKETARFISSLHIRRVHLLPYHHYGESKYQMLGKIYALKDLDALSDQDLAAAADLFKEFGLSVNIGGE